MIKVKERVKLRIFNGECYLVPNRKTEKFDKLTLEYKKAKTHSTLQDTIGEEIDEFFEKYLIEDFDKQLFIEK